ncbi:lysis protein [Pseudomonas boanensis]|uniref:lysis protein n=1 Tax=Metapseudomonas boanensis TaxID=2822138 RepID=UPI0035D45E4B
MVAAWTAQGWRLGRQLAEQGRAHAIELAKRDKLYTDTLAEISRAAAKAARDEQDKRLKLEHQLQADDETNHRILTDAQKANARLRDQLATADLRLSVLLDATDAAAGRGCGVPAAAGTGSVVDGAPRARLDPAHAQRIVGITSDGDQGLIALKACQDYARQVSARH